MHVYVWCVSCCADDGHGWQDKRVHHDGPATDRADATRGVVGAYLSADYLRPRDEKSTHIGECATNSRPRLVQVAVSNINLRTKLAARPPSLVA
jgi:hypothetical protein